MTTESTLAHYAKVASFYGEFWGDGPEGSYPANRIRWDIVRSRLKALGVKTILEAGCGEGSPLAVLRADGYDAWGFDFSPEMIDVAATKVPVGRVWVGDATDTNAYIPPWHLDAVIALGPFPHLDDDQQAIALRNCAQATKPGGRVFVELRNSWFSLWTLNRYTWALFDGLLSEAPPAIRLLTERHLNLAAPPIVTDVSNYNSTFSRFNAPGDVPALFAQAGLRVETIHPYHAHACAPMYADRDPKWFREASLALEWPNPTYTSWQTLLRCSAFVVEAVRE